MSIPGFDVKERAQALKVLADQRIKEELGPIFDLTDTEAREVYRARAEACAEEFFGPEWDIVITFTVGHHFPNVVVREYFH